jgi:hypothetical protein
LLPQTRSPGPATLQKEDRHRSAGSCSTILNQERSRARPPLPCLLQVPQGGCLISICVCHDSSEALESVENFNLFHSQ